MSGGDGKFCTKNTLGMLTIDWTTPGDFPEEEKTPEQLEQEEKIKAIVRAKRLKKEASRRKNTTRSQSPTPKEEKPKKTTKKRAASPKKSKPPPPPPPKEDDDTLLKNAQEEEAARKKQAQEEEARLAAAAEEEARRQKAAEEEEAAAAAATATAAKLKQEEAARLKKLEEAARKKQAQQDEERLAAAAAEEEARRKKVAEEEAAAAAEELAKKKAERKVPARRQSLGGNARRTMQRRVSFFPLSRDNTGLNQAVRKYRYDADVPFEWEKPEWTMNFGKLKHVETQSVSFGWSKPEWALRSMLRKTDKGEKVKTGQSLERRPSLGRPHSFDHRVAWAKPDWTTTYRFRNKTSKTIVECNDSNSSIEDYLMERFGESSSSQKSFSWEKPEWAKANVLKATEAGAAVRQGVNLALPVEGIKDFLKRTAPAADAEAQAEEEALGSSMLSLNASFNTSRLESVATAAWQKPSWASNPGLKRTSKGEKLRERGTLAKPITFPKGKDS